MPTIEVFNIRLLIREHLAKSSNPNPHVVAAEIAATIPDEHLREALAAVLPMVVVSVAGTQRRSGPHKTKKPLIRRPTGRRGRAAAAASYAGLLAERIRVADEWKFLGECTRTDLRAAAAIRQIHAEQNATWAHRYERLAKLMAEGQTVADLPLEMIQEALG